MAIALVLLFFLPRDGARMWQWLVDLVPARRRNQVDAAAREGWTTLVAYVRGTVIVAAVDAVGIGIARPNRTRTRQQLRTDAAPYGCGYSGAAEKTPACRRRSTEEI